MHWTKIFINSKLMLYDARRNFSFWIQIECSNIRMLVTFIAFYGIKMLRNYCNKCTQANLDAKLFTQSLYCLEFEICCQFCIPFFPTT